MAHPGGTVPNFAPGLLDFLAERYGDTVTAEDLFAYLAAVLSHPGTRRPSPLTWRHEVFAFP